MQVIQRDKFSPTDSDNIGAAFLKHHVVSGVPMTAQEIQGLRIALNVRGFRAMRHLGHRIFFAALPFWFPVPKENLCDWEDIVVHLSLGLIWNVIIEMRDRYWLRVQRDGRGDGFHLFVDYLLGDGVKDEGVPTRDLVVKAC